MTKSKKVMGRGKGKDKPISNITFMTKLEEKIKAEERKLKKLEEKNYILKKKNKLLKESLKNDK